MRKIFIEYDSSSKNINILVDDSPVKKSSGLNFRKDISWQQQIEQLPNILIDEYNNKSFSITFKGSNADYKFLSDVVDKANKNGMKIDCRQLSNKIDKKPKEKNPAKEPMPSKTVCCEEVKKQSPKTEKKNKKNERGVNQKMKELFIKHDVWKKRTEISTLESAAAGKVNFVLEDRNIQGVLKPLVNLLKKKYNEKQFVLYFIGRESEYRALAHNIKFSYTEGLHISLEYFSESMAATFDSSNAEKAVNVADDSIKKDTSKKALYNKEIPKGMRKVSIVYNTYTVNTEILVDGKPVKESSELHRIKQVRLQEWIEDLPRILADEYNTKSFYIYFKGTKLDYDDVKSTVDDANKHGWNIKLDYGKAAEIADKEEKIKKIFDEIQKESPFPALRSKALRESFNNVYNGTFPVNVVATMSSGKSTLINALLGRKLMPASQEACTAIITEIQDNDNEKFSAKVYGKDGSILEEQSELTLDIMSRLNANDKVARIQAKGDIPFIDAKDTSLVLLDTPGPNNSRDARHEKATKEMLDASSKAMVLYIMNGTQFATNDDNSLLSYVAESMKVKGKQSKDRFIFVVNKLDTFKPDEDSVEHILDKARDYLKDNGIENPNIFPASALTALNIRTNLKNIDKGKRLNELMMEYLENDEDIPDYLNDIKRINKHTELHLDKYTKLPPRIQDEVNSILEKAKTEGDFATEALVHSGIITIEAVIRMYVEKYSRPAKIKNIVDTFQERLENAGVETKLQEDLATDEQKRDVILNKINSIEKKLETARNGIDFTKSINFEGVKKEAKNKVIEICQGAMRAQVEESDKIRGKELEYAEVKMIKNTFDKFIKDSDIDVQLKLERVIKIYIKDVANNLIEKYKSTIRELSKEASMGNINLDILKITSGQFDKFNVEAVFRDLYTTKEVDTGKYRTIDNPERSGFFGWFKFWKPSTIDEKIYKTVKYVKGQEFSKKYFEGYVGHIAEYRDEAEKQINRGMDLISKDFGRKIDELNKIMADKLRELKSSVNSKEAIEATIRKTRENQQWLDKINREMKALLDI